MKYNSISGLLTAIADEIRAKDGSSELINPQDLPERIAALPLGGEEEYGIYLKILEVPAKIDGGKDSTLNVDSPEVVEFFSDAFEWRKVVNIDDGFDAYYQNMLPNYFAIVAYEAKKKDMGLPNVYDTLQKRVPILAVKTKLGDVEKLLFINDITREDNGELIGYNSSFSVNFDMSEDTIYGMWRLTVQFRKDGIFIASID